MIQSDTILARQQKRDCTFVLI